jgi:hypothetical protein
MIRHINVHHADSRLLANCVPNRLRTFLLWITYRHTLIRPFQGCSPELGYHSYNADMNPFFASSAPL